MPGIWSRLIGHLADWIRRPEGELAEEFEVHLTFLVQSRIERGMDPASARQEALREFGSPAAARQLAREARAFAAARSVVQDVRYGLRQFGHNPTFATIAVIILALGIAASALVFSLTRAVFWDPLPVPGAHGLVRISWTSPERPFAGDWLASETWDSRIAEGQTIGSFSYNAYQAIRDGTARFQHVAAHRSALGGVLDEFGSFDVQAVSGNYFQTLGVSAVIGRTITSEDDRIATPGQVAMISYGFWQRAFGGREDVLDRDIEIRGVPLRIVGVIPPGLAGLDPASPRDVMVSLATYYAVGVTSRAFDPNDWQGLELFGRLAPGSSRQSAAAEAETLVAQNLLAAPDAGAYVPPRIQLDELGQSGSFRNLRERTATPLMLIGAVVGAIFVISCINIAGLLLARSQSRAHEIATRLALGASRGRVARQFLVESFVLSIVGGVLGIGLAYAVSPLSPDLFGQLLGNMTLQGHLVLPGLDATPDWTVLSLVCLLMLTAGCGFGSVPALGGTRMDLSARMKSGLAGSGRRLTRFPGHKTLVAVQIALVVPLVAGAGLFVQTVLNLQRVPIGWEPENVLFAMVASSREDRPRVVDTLRQIESLPGVRSASVSVWPLFNNAEPRPMCVPVADPVNPETVDLEYVFPRFFETWGVPVVLGREFLADGEAGVAVVNQAFARQYYGGGSPIGGTIDPGACSGDPRTIVGMVADHIDRQRADLVPMIYLPYPTGGALEPNTFALRTADDPRALIPTIRELISKAGFNADGDVSTGRAYRARTMQQERFMGGILLGFSCLAVLVASVGVYGMLNYTVTCRTQEIGIRMALGAAPSRLKAWILGESLGPLLLGAAAGTGIALGLARLVDSMVFGVDARDPLTLGVTLLILLATAAIAAFLPVYRSARIDPLRTLRHE